MRAELGVNYHDLKDGKTTPIYYDTSTLINGHLFMVGSSGVGKSHTFRKLIESALRSGSKARFHIFDVHGDLEVPGASTAVFGEHVPYGVNPLRVNPSPEFGGPRRSIQAFIRIVNQASATSLGVKQESVLYNLLSDVYRDFGFQVEEPGSWSLHGGDRPVPGATDNRLYLQVPMAEKDAAKALGARWDPGRSSWWVHTEKYQGDLRKWPPAHIEKRHPDLNDVVRYARRLHEERFLGSDQRAVLALAEVNRAARAVQRKALDAARARHHNAHFDSDMDSALMLAADKAMAAYKAYLKSIRTGYELENLLKYDSPEVLKSTLDRLQNLSRTGIFKPVAPPFDPSCPVWRYNLKPLSPDEKKMMVLFLLQDLFTQASQRSPQSDVVDVLVLDELAVYLGPEDEKGDGIIGRIAREARKFGVALWAANQSPERVPASLLSSVGTKIILGLDELYWNEAVSKLRVEARQLSWIQPRRTMAVQLKEIGAVKNRWHWVSLR